jgi:hypothetical protein
MQLDTAQQLNRISVLMAAVFAVVAGVTAGAQPELEITPGPQPVNVGEEFRISLEVAWSGAPGDYTVLPAEVDPVEWGTFTLLPPKAYVRDGRNVVELTIAFVADQPGEYETPAILVPYLRPEDVQKPEKPDTPMHLNALDAPPKLRADPFPLLVQPHTTPAWLFGVLGALSFCIFGLAGWWFWSRRRSTQAVGEGAPSSDAAVIAQKLESAKRRRIEGDFYGMYRDLAAAAQLMRSQDLAARLSSRADAAGYRGVRPTDDEIDGDLRAIQRALEQEALVLDA